MSYPSIRIEGAIFSPDILERLEEAPGQRPADFNLDSGTKVKDEIARAWADAQDYWRIFQRKLDSLKPDSPATTETRQQWIVPLFGLLGYQLEYQPKGVELNGKNYTISHRAINRGSTPVHVVGYHEVAGLDRKPERTHIGAPRMSAHGLVQEYLNLHDELYGLVTNGRLLRLLRDSSRLIKLTYLEFDLDRIFIDGLFADFAVLYRLLHATRLPHSNDAAAESLIERYHQDSLDSGARIRDGLSKAVEQAIRDFANGFVTHRDNEALRQSIRDGKLAPETYYQHLLRLIYRLLFLLVIEERDLIFPATATRQQRDIFRRYYSVERLRLLSEKRHLADKRFHDHWLALLATFRLFEAHGPGEKLGVAPLAGDLFSPAAIGPLAQCKLGNDVLLGCLRSLGLYQHPDNGQTIRVNYAALNVEEFGSVYEGLLEFQPVFLTAGERVEFDFAQGDQRAATGSHYTPDDLVQPLIKHSLDYLIAEALKKPEPAKALLDLRVADISCGSGHILLAAARRIATELAVVRTGEEQPSPSAFRAAIRDVIRECIYGVDLNPLAVELCKVALWLEAHTPGEPLNFLDHHIKCGNAIVGFARREEAERGVPDEAFKTLPDDDKDTAAILRKRNKKEREDHAAGQLPLSASLQKQLDDILRGWNELNRLPEHTPDEIEAKKARYLAFTQSKDAWLLHQIASIPIAQFYLPKAADNLQKFVTDATYRRYWKGEISPQGQATAEAWAMAERKRFFHWFLEFPEIIERGGFDCILGNPPYLGGNRIANRYGWMVAEYLKAAFKIDGNSDLVVYFLNRAFQLLRHTGCMAMIASQSIKEGTSRSDGLQRFLEASALIGFSRTNQRWPGRAATNIDLIALWKRERVISPLLNERFVACINSFLQDGNEESSPVALLADENRAFVGVALHGDGFVLTTSEATALIEADQKNANVVRPFLIGDDLNGRPDLSPSRYAIDFGEMNEDEAREYTTPYRIVSEQVFPSRATNNRPTYKTYWWRFGERRVNLHNTIREISRYLVVAKTSKHLSFEFLSGLQFVLDQSLTVLPLTEDHEWCVVQSSIHEAWARRFSSNQGGTPRYNATTALQNYPFPDASMYAKPEKYQQLCADYLSVRKILRHSLWLGLTDIYNMFHTRDLTPAEVARVSKKPLPEAEAGYQGILELRRLHRELDLAIRDAYGWTDLDLGHDFIEVETLPENDRVRYTINPAARKEVLKRLLAENHKRAALQSQAADAAKTKKKRGKKAAGSEGTGDLF
jgi:methylase of polypeptide subunit release factors